MRIQLNVISILTLFGAVLWLGADRPVQAADVQRQVLVTGMARPVYCCQAPGDNDRLFIVEQHTGQIRIYKNSTGVMNAAPFITIGPIATGNEQGLLGLAFHPNYQTNGFFYVKRTGPGGGGDNEIFERYSRGADADTGDPAGALQLLYLTGSASNHNAGWVGFGPGGYLFLAMGDAGGGDDTHGAIGNGQNRNSFYGKMLRVDVNSITAANVAAATWASNTVTITTAAAHNLVSMQSVRIAGVSPAGYNGTQNIITVTGANTFTYPLTTNPGAYVSGGTATPGYRVPATNPYFGSTTMRPEIWAFGLRNPFRCSFDRSTNDLWIGDVGQNTREEVDVIPAAATAPLNFGWRVREGFIQNPAYPAETCVTTPTDPVRDYIRSVGSTVIGGYVYRGSVIPAVAGRYFHADYGSGRVWTFEYSGGTFINLTDRTAELNAGNPTMASISSFGEDNAGELYIVELGGRVSKILPLVTGPSITTASPLAAWTQNRAGYSQTLASTGGTGPYTYTVTVGSLPAGLSLSSAGVISGTPTGTGTANFTVQVTATAGGTGTKAFAITINAAQVITTVSPLTSANIGSAYSQTLAATGGTGAKTWSLQSGALPAGLTLSGAGVIAGNPTATGVFNFTALVTDAVGATATKAFALTVNNNLTVTTASPLPAWTVGRAYSQTFAASGGLPAYTWTVTVGAVPVGLTLSTGGLLSGTPTTAATTTFTVQVADTTAGTATKSISVTINAAPAISTVSPLPNGNVGVAYSQTLAATGGTAPLVWSIQSGSLPAGLTLSSAGLIAGTPTAAVTANFTALVTDAAGATNTKAFVLSTSSAPTITSLPVTTANLGVAYSYTVTASGAPAPTFSLTANPAGMTINGTSGAISWNPATAGSFNVTVQAANGTLPNATQSFTIVVGDYGLTGRPAATPYLNMPPTEAGAIPALLSATGTFSNTLTLTPSAALIPFDVNAPLWSDGAVKSRWISVPTGQTITFAAQYNWTFPAGTVLVKHFELPVDDANPLIRKRLETRLLVIKADGSSYGVTYHWRTDNSDADLLPGSLDENISIATAGGGTRTQTWTYPSRANCLSCHTAVAGHVLGVRTNQLNGNFTYTQTGQTDNQVRTWSHIGMFSTAVNETLIPGYDKLVKVTDTSATLATRVRSYWASNCMQCHQPGGTTPAPFDARFETPLASQYVVSQPLVTSNFGIDSALVVAPQDKWRSILRYRMNSVNPAEQMPPLGKHVVDANAMAALDAWIDSLPGTPALPPPVIAPNGGSFTGTVSVTITDPDGAATIRYTTDGTDPIATSPLYAGAFTLSATTTVKARVFRAGYTMSIVTTAAFTLNNLAPVITSGVAASPNPVVSATTTALTVTASDPDSGPAALSYQWVTLSGPATVTFSPNNSPVANLTTATFTASGTYTLGVIVTDGADNDTDNITISVTLPPAGTAPSISGQPASQTVTAGTSATFTVTAGGTGPLSYQWRRGGVNIGGATFASYTTPATVLADTGATFSVVVTNAYGSVTSGTATLTVNPAGGGGNPITLNLASLSFRASPVNLAPIPGSLTLTNTSGSAITVTLASSAGWLSGSPSMVTIPAGATATLTVTADPAGQTGTVTGVLTITNTPGGATQTIPVSLTVTAGSGKRGGCELTAGNGLPGAGGGFSAGWLLWSGVLLASLAFLRPRAQAV